MQIPELAKEPARLRAEAELRDSERAHVERERESSFETVHSD